MEAQLQIVLEDIASKIYFIRGEKVILDFDLAGLYGVSTKVLKQAVRRNNVRFPKDFMFEISDEELKILRSQIVTSSWGGLRYRPYAFTEQGVAMLSGIRIRLPSGMKETQNLPASKRGRSRSSTVLPYPVAYYKRKEKQDK